MSLQYQAKQACMHMYTHVHTHMYGSDTYPKEWGPICTRRLRRVRYPERTQAQHDKNRERQARLKSVRVVGVTCLSSQNKQLGGHRFAITVLDECSQMVEPASLLPIANFHTQFLLAVGDPNQLPPVLAPSACDGASGGKDGVPIARMQNLCRPLFSRLEAGGYKPVLLRTQYRCHPMLSGGCCDVLWFRMCCIVCK